MSSSLNLTQSSPVDLVCDMKNPSDQSTILGQTAIKCHLHLEECTIGHARLMGLASPVDLLNPAKAVHDDEQT